MEHCSKNWQICYLANFAGYDMDLVDTITANDGGAFGEVLRITRERSGVTIEAMAKKTGLRCDQLLALERSDSAAFKYNNQEMLWAARLYARKLGLDMPTGIRFAKPPNNKLSSSVLRPNAIPAFLMKAP